MKNRRQRQDLNTPEQRFDQWWLRSPVVEIAGGRSRARAGAEFWYQHFWKPRELSVWLYELVRRLPNTRVEIDRSTRRLLQEMPPYPNLSLEQKLTLVAIINRELNPKLISQERAVLPAQHLPEWKQGQAAKLANWFQVEALNKPVDEATREDRRYAREHAAKYLPLMLAAWKVMSINRRSKLLQSVPHVEENALARTHFSAAEFRQSIDRALMTKNHPH